MILEWVEDEEAWLDGQNVFALYRFLRTSRVRESTMAGQLMSPLRKTAAVQWQRCLRAKIASSPTQRFKPDSLLARATLQLA